MLAAETLSVALFVKDYIQDVNKDGKVDCIDYALIFYIKYKNDYPNKPIDIVWYCDVNKRLSHLYVAFNIPGTDQYWHIEPKATDPVFMNRTMPVIWGADFAYGSSRKMTDKFEQIYYNTIQWLW
jgi:hypothetical protein